MTGEPGRIVVVGLGPAGADLLVPAARAALESSPVRYVRTARHPAVAELAADGIDLEAFDAHYEAASDLDACYRSIVAALLAAAREHGTVAYAVPGCLCAYGCYCQPPVYCSRRFSSWAANCSCA